MLQKLVLQKVYRRILIHSHTNFKNVIASRIDAASSARFSNLKFAAAVLIVVQHVFNIMRPGVHDIARSFIVSGITGVAVPLFSSRRDVFLLCILMTRDGGRVR